MTLEEGHTDNAGDAEFNHEVVAAVQVGREAVACWALVEIDALDALELKLTIDELCTIYRTQFPVLREYEKNTWYDKNGRIAFTTNRGLTGVGRGRKQFEIWQACLKNGEALPKAFERQNLEPPFEVRDREADMRTAYAYFAERLGMVTDPGTG